MKTRQGVRAPTVVALLLVAVVTRIELHADEAEDKAVKAIQKLRGKITRNEKAAGKPIVTVYLSCTEVTDRGLKVLAGLPQLRILNIRNTKVTDRGVADLQKALPKLRIIRRQLNKGGKPRAKQRANSGTRG